MKFISVLDYDGERMLLNLSEVSCICRIDDPDMGDLAVTKDNCKYECHSELGAVKAAACIIEL